jgi:hypothetical protein
MLLIDHLCWMTKGVYLDSPCRSNLVLTNQKLEIMGRRSHLVSIDFKLLLINTSISKNLKLLADVRPIERMIYLNFFATNIDVRQ